MREELAVMLDEANQTVLAQYLGQLLHREMGHSLTSGWWLPSAEECKPRATRQLAR